VKGERYDAVGLFKSENKDTFLKVSTKNDVTLSGVEVFELETLQGINLNKVDKGCLIYNTNKEQGYLMSIIDGTSRAETSYWMDDFLQVRQRQDEYFETQETLTLYKEYITKQLPQEFEITKADQADFLNKSLSFFKEKEEFKMEEFTGEVLGDQEVIQSFNAFKTQYEDERDYALSDEFAINDAAVKKNARIFKSVIKLDKNFHIYIHGDRKLIQQGQDENGKYYMLYFEEEN
ncbi:MAG: nucleoid-associated protein, partial [Cloacibacterium sp.]